MKIDWKQLAASPGYISLKTAYVKDCQNNEARKRRNHSNMRDNAEFRKLFTWVISRAQHYAHFHGRSIEYVLNAWEVQRGKSWWLNHYGNSHQYRLFKMKVLKRMGVRGLKKYYKRMGFDGRSRGRYNAEPTTRTGKKARYSERWKKLRRR